MASEVNYFDQVPAEVIAIIFRHLDEDFEWMQKLRWKMTAIPLICKRFNQILCDDLSWAQRLKALKVSFKISDTSEPNMKVENAKGTIYSHSYNRIDYAALSTLNIVRIEELTLEFYGPATVDFDRREHLFQEILFAKCQTVTKLSILDTIDIRNYYYGEHSFPIINKIVHKYAGCLKQAKVERSVNSNFPYFSRLLLEAPNLNSLHLHIPEWNLPYGRPPLDFSDAIGVVKEIWRKAGRKGTFTLRWNTYHDVPFLSYWLKNVKDGGVKCYETVETRENTVVCIRDKFVMIIELLI